MKKVALQSNRLVTTGHYP